MCELYESDPLISSSYSRRSDIHEADERQIFTYFIAAIAELSGNVAYELDV